MRSQGPKETIYNYLMHSSKLEDNLAQSSSISILKEYKMFQDILYIVTYTDLNAQQICASIIVHRTQSGAWELAHFLLMGGTGISELLPERPQIMWSRFTYLDTFFTGFVILPKSLHATSMYIQDRSGYGYEQQLEDNTTLLITKCALTKPLSIEVLNHDSVLLLRGKIE